MRYAVHILFLLFVCLALGVKDVAKTGRPMAQVGRGICMWVMPASFMFGGGAIGANLWSAFWLMPIFILIMVALGDRVGKGPWIAVIAAHVGAMMVLGTDLGNFSPKTMIPAFGGLSFAVYVLLSRHLRGEPAATSLFYTALIPLVGMAPITIAVWHPIQSAEVWKIVAIGITGLMSLYSLDRAMEILSPAFVAPLLYGAVISEPLVEFLRSGGLPDPGQIAGSLVLLGVGSIMVLRSLAAGGRHG